MFQKLVQVEDEKLEQRQQHKAGKEAKWKLFAASKGVEQPTVGNIGTNVEDM